LVASLAIELKISPDQVLAMDEVMFKAVVQVLGDRAKERLMPVNVTGVQETLKAMRKFDPDLAKQMNKQI
jgi:hypothetical protein